MDSKSMKHNVRSEGAIKRRDRSRAGRVVVVGAVSVFGLRRILRRHNAALHSAATALTETVAAPGVHDERLATTEADPDTHAIGHTHMMPPERRTSTRLSHRAWRRSTPRADHTSHPPRA